MFISAFTIEAVGLQALTYISNTFVETSFQHE